MTTMVEKEPQVAAPADEAESTNTEQERQAEIDELVEFKRKRVRDGNATPCPACNTLVEIHVNECPHCNSYIAPNNALVRESLRRLDELTAQLDGEHGDLLANKGKRPKRSLGERLKSLFTGPKPVEPEAPQVFSPDDPRFLEYAREGDHLKVLEHAGAWLKVKARDGKTGWIYSTIVREP